MSEFIINFQEEDYIFFGGFYQITCSRNVPGKALLRTPESWSIIGKGLLNPASLWLETVEKVHN